MLLNNCNFGEWKENDREKEGKKELKERERKKGGGRKEGNTQPFLYIFSTMFSFPFSFFSLSLPLVAIIFFIVGFENGSHYLQFNHNLWN